MTDKKNAFKWLIASFFIAAAILSTPLISAFDFDNSKSFTKDNGKGGVLEYGKIEITNAFGFGSKLWTGELRENTKVCYKNCASEIEITIYEKGTLIDDISFYKINGNKRDLTQIKSYEFQIREEITVDNYGCNWKDTGNIYKNGSKEIICNYGVIGSIKEFRSRTYDPKEELAAGTYSLKLTGSKKPSEIIDWVIKTKGVYTDEWAVWGNISSGDTAQVFLETPANNYTLLANPITFNCSAKTLETINVTVGGSTSYKENNGFSLTSGGTDASELAMQFQANYNGQLNNWFTWAGGAFAGDCWIYNGSVYNENQKQYVGAWNGDYCEFTTPFNLIAGNTYWLASEGNHVEKSLVPGAVYPVNRTTVNITNFYAEGWGNQASWCKNIYGVNVTINTASTGAVSRGLINLSLIINNQINFTVTNASAGQNLTLSKSLTTLSPINWTCLACDNDTCGYALENRTLNIEANYPIVNITYPFNNSVIIIFTPTTNLSFNATQTVVDNNLESCWFYNGVTNVSISCNNNTQLNNTGGGDYILYWYANDTIGHLGTAKVNFTVNSIGSAASFSSTVVEGENTTFYLYINATSSATLLANLTYNNTVYPMSVLSSGYNKTFYKTLTAPSVAADTIKPFTINYTINGDKYGNNYSQLVYDIPPMNISAFCSSPSLTFNLLDEENLTSLNGTFEYNFYYGLSNSTVVRTFGKVDNSYTFSLCVNTTINNNWTLGRGEIFYRTTGWVDRRYYVFDGTILTNVTTNITLHDLVAARQTSFKLEVETTSLTPYVNKYASLIRWYPDLNEYRTVDMGLTDEKGETVIHVRTEDVDYRIGIYDRNGSLIKLANPIRMVCLVSPCTYTLKISPTEDDFTSFLNVQYSFTFNETSGIWRFIYSDPSGKINTMNLTIYKDTGTSSYPICSDTITGVSGAVSCNTSLYTGLLKGIVTRAASPEIPFVSKVVNVVSSALKSPFGLWLSLLIIIPIIFIFAFVSPVVAIIGGVIALIPAFYFGSINLAILGGFAILGGIIIHFLKRIG